MTPFFMRHYLILLYKKMTNIMNESTKELLQYFLCVFCIVGAMVMSFLAMYIDPRGVIDNSILWLIAQVLVFCGSLMGINTLNNIQIKKIGSMKDSVSNIKNNQNEA